MSKASSETARTPPRPSTPTNQRPVSGNTTGDTPCKSHSTSRHNVLHGFLDEKREGNLEDFDYIAVEVESRLFMEHVLPPVKPGIDQNQIVDQLKGSGVIVEDSGAADETTKFCWRDFAPTASSKACHEDAVFAPLQRIFDAVTGLATAQSRNGLQATVLLRMRPNHTPKSHRGTTNRPDFYFILRSDELDAQRREDEIREKLEVIEQNKKKKDTMRPEDSVEAKSTSKPRKKESIRVDREWYSIALTGEVKRSEGVKNQDDVSEHISLIA